jgi:hypothetical protein
MQRKGHEFTSLNVIEHLIICYATIEDELE